MARDVALLILKLEKDWYRLPRLTAMETKLNSIATRCGLSAILPDICSAHSNSRRSVKGGHTRRVRELRVKKSRFNSLLLPKLCGLLQSENEMKQLTRDQLQSRKEKAIRFVRDVLGDPDRAEEIADESLEDYAERRKIQITNPSRRRNAIMATNKSKAELEAEIDDLKDENAELQDQLDTIADIVAPADEGEYGDADDEEEEDDQD